MNPYCKYCPPLHFQTHAQCHAESIKFRINTRKLKLIRQHISNADFLLICQKKKQLDELFYFCYCDAHFKTLAKKVRRFNKLISIFLIRINYFIPHSTVRRHLG